MPKKVGTAKDHAFRWCLNSKVPRSTSLVTSTKASRDNRLLVENYGDKNSYLLVALGP